VRLYPHFGSTKFLLVLVRSSNLSLSQVLSEATFLVPVGSEFPNCDGSRNPIQVSRAITDTTSETWSVSVTLGIEVPVVFTVTGSWSQTKEQSITQSVQVEVDPDTKVRSFFISPPL
jgi:hypothetical protein